MSLPLWAYGQTQPRFQSGIEVTSVDITVVDSRGQAIPDLRPAEFVVRVDGVPRQVVSADWIPRTTSAAGGPPDASGPATSSNELAAAGRLVVIMIDQPNIRPGGVIGYRAAINGFIDRLPPIDRVSVVNLGAGATSVSFGTDREQVKRVVSTSLGGVPYPPSEKTPGDLTFDAIRALIGTLRPIDAPKTVVLVSQGLTFSDDVRPSLVELERAAAAARTTVYALRLAGRVQDITQSQIGPADGLPPADRTSSSGINSREQEVPAFPAGPAGDRGAVGIEAAGGLEGLAAATGGAMFDVTMTADAALARVEAEMGGRYLLGLETRASDRDGRPHSLVVEVQRPGITVRTGRYLPDARDFSRVKVEDRLAEALASPIALSGLRLRVATGSARDADATHVRLLIRAEIGSGYRSPQAVLIGVVIADRDGAPIFSRSGTAKLQPSRPGDESPLQYSGSASLPPGDYTLRLAVIEGERAGSVEHPFRVVLP